MASPAAILQVFVNANTKVASAQLAAFDRQLSTVGKTSAATGVSMGKMTKGATAAGAGIAAVGAVAIVAGKQLYDLGKQFDAAYDTIRVRTGATGRELEKLKGSFRDVAKNVPNDFEDVGKAVGDLNTRLGLTGKPLERMAENMLHLSNITGDDLEGSIRAVAVAFNDFQIPLGRQEKALNGLFRLYQASGVSVAQLAESVQKFGSPLRQLGFSFGEAASMFAAFERAGVNTQTMMPGLRMAIRNLTQPSADLAARMQDLGIQAGKPEKALQGVLKLLGNSSNLSVVEKTGLAYEVFGTRAGADMAEAIKQGRFELDKFLKIFRDNNGDTIRRAADDSYDFSENVRILGNNLKIFLEPAANTVFVALDDVTRALNQAVKQMDGTSKRTTTLGTIFRIVSQIVYGAVKIFQVFFRTTKRTIEGIIQIVRGFVQMFKGSFQMVTGLLTGNWRKAWRGARNFAKGALTVIVGAVKSITAPVRSVFQGIFEIVKDKFRLAYQSAVNFINKIISVLNSIPFLPDIGLVGGRNFGEGSSQRGPAAVGGQRGGILSGGSPSGDSIPAMLERGEYVLNRKAVEKIGIERLNHINFKTAPRFQQGGAIGLQGGGYLDTLTEFPAKFVKPIVDAGTAALDLLLKGPGQFIKMLPKPNILQPFTGIGPYLLDMAKAFIRKNAQSPLKNNEWVDSNTFAVANFLASKFGASISSSYRSPAQNAAVGGVPNSSHTRGTPSNPGAFDFVPPSGGMQSFAGKNIAGIVENMIHDVGSGLHNHIAFFQRGGSVARGSRALRKGRQKGKGPGFYPGKAQINALNPAIARLIEEIELFERQAGADWSEAGSELSENETATLVRQYQKLKAFYEKQRNLIRVAIKALNGSINAIQKALKSEKDDKKKDKLKKNLRITKSARSRLNERKIELEGLTTRGGLIGDTAFRLNELGVGVTVSPGPSDSELASLLREQLTATQRALAVSQAQMPIFQQFMPKFHQGGIVQGPRGAERPVMAQAGEGIFTRDQMRAMGSQNITVVIEDAAIDSNRIRVEVDGIIQDKVSTVRRQGSNRRFATR